LNAEYINPFILGSQRVLDTMCGSRPALGKVYLKKPPHAPQQLAIVIRIIGAFQGTVVYSLGIDTACYLASMMMGGMPVATLDFMSESAVSELCNMISGSVATAFSEKEILIDISPPEFTTDSYPDLEGNVVCIPLQLQNGSVFEVGVYVV